MSGTLLVFICNMAKKNNIFVHKKHFHVVKSELIVQNSHTVIDKISIKYIVEGQEHFLKLSYEDMNKKFAEAFPNL